MRPIEGMSVLVTGGGSGLGEGMARHFTARGAKVTISGRRLDKIEAVARDIGAGCAAVAGDDACDVNFFEKSHLPDIAFESHQSFIRLYFSSLAASSNRT